MLAVVIGCLILCLPLFFKVYVYYNSNINRLFLTIKFAFLIEKGIYIRLSGKRLFVHVTDKKAIAINLVDTKSMLSGNADIFNHFEFYKHDLFLNIPYTVTGTAAALVGCFFKSTLLPVYSLELFYEMSFFLNILSVILLLIKSLGAKK